MKANFTHNRIYKRKSLALISNSNAVHEKVAHCNPTFWDGERDKLTQNAVEKRSSYTERFSSGGVEGEGAIKRNFTTPKRETTKNPPDDY